MGKTVKFARELGLRFATVGLVIVWLTLVNQLLFNVDEKQDYEMAPASSARRNQPDDFADSLDDMADEDSIQDFPDASSEPNAIERVCDSQWRRESMFPIDEVHLLSALYVVEQDLERGAARETHLLLRRRLACLFYGYLKITKSDPKSLLSASDVLERLEGAAIKYFDAYFETMRKKEILIVHHPPNSAEGHLCAQAWFNGCRAPGAPRKDLGRTTKNEFISGDNCVPRGIPSLKFL
mmetsp:Transcript_13646/g.27950  ORF Transcript_13646/g.27950 Transcript_13646/m.27950 type:complete len:238 (-) Transcript_13646:28-741(-)